MLKRVFALLIVSLCGVALAHPRNELVQAAYLQLQPEGVALELDLTAGDLVAGALLVAMDANRDGQLSQAEVEAYAVRVVRQLRLTVDGQNVPLEVAGITAPSTKALLAGGGVLQLKVQGYVAERPGAHALEFVNAHAPVKSAYLANAFVSSERFQMNRQTRSDDQSQYRLEYALAGLDTSSTALWIIGTLLTASGIAYVTVRRRLSSKGLPVRVEGGATHESL